MKCHNSIAQNNYDLCVMVSSIFGESGAVSSEIITVGGALGRGLQGGT